MFIKEHYMKGLLAVIGSIFILAISIVTLPKIIHKAEDVYKNQHGITAVAAGTVCDKNYLAAHSDTTWVLFVSSTTFHPEEWQIQISKFDPSTKKMGDC